MMRYALAGILAGSVILTEAQVYAPRLTPVGRARISAIYAVAADQRYLYALERGVVHVLDPLDPARPREVGSVEFDRPRSRLALRFPFLYLVGFNQPLGIANVADPAHPVWTGDAGEFPRTASDGLELAGDYGYLIRNGEPTAAGSTLTLDVLDLVSDPARPKRLGTIDLGVRVRGEYGGVTAAPGRVFVVVSRAVDPTPRSRLIAIDTRDPAVPRIQRIWLLPEGKVYKDVEVRGELVYLLQAESGPGTPAGLTIYRMPASGDLELLGEALTPQLGIPIDLIVAGEVVYASFKSGGMLATFDVSDPRAPTLTSTYRPPDTWAAGLGMALQGQRLYVAGDNDPTPIFDVSNARAPRQLGRYEFEGGSASDVFVEGDLAVVQSSSNLILYDLTNPAAPRRVGRFKGIQSSDPKDYPFQVVTAVYGRLAFVTYDTRPAQVVDLHDSQHPRVLSGFEPRGLVYASLLTESHAVLGYGEGESADARGGVEIVAVQDPAKPRTVARLELERPVTALALRGDRLLAAHPDGELLIIGLHDWERPRVLGRLAATARSSAAQVALSADATTAYLTQVDPRSPDRGVLTVIDLHDASRPRALGRLDIPTAGSMAMPLVVQGTTIILLAGSTGGVAVIDVRRPRQPVLTTIQSLPSGYAERLALRDRNVLLAAGEDGLLIYRR